MTPEYVPTAGPHPGAWGARRITIMLRCRPSSCARGAHLLCWGV
ncbi:hypothetical protein [Streptomyces sp. NBC_01538]